MKIAVLFAASVVFARHGTLVQQAPPQSASVANPYEDSDDARRAGQKLFHRECAACHGENAEGTPGRPALNRPEIRSAPAGALFWVLRNGSLRRGMPSFAHLPEQQRWQIITYIRSLGK